MKRSRWLIVLLIMTLAGVTVATVVMADPIGDLLSPDPEPTATAVVQATAVTMADGTPVRVYTVSGTDPCEFSVGAKHAGWWLTYQFTKPGTQGKLTNLTTGATVADISVTIKQFPIAGSIVLDGTVTKYRIESTAEWGYTLRPPDGTAIETLARSQSAGSETNFKRQFCSG